MLKQVLIIHLYIPGDRCTTVPYYEDDEEEVNMRFARNKDGKRIEVPASMKYEEFKKKYID